jgi:formylglycine-generating enzyme
LLIIFDLLGVMNTTATRNLRFNRRVKAFAPAMVLSALLFTGCLTGDKNATGKVGVQGRADAAGVRAEPLPETWENSLGMVFRPIPGRPVRMSIWETRVGDFEAFVEATGYDATFDVWSFVNERWAQHGISWADPGFEQTARHPVTCISWMDAEAFCEWLTSHERATGRLSASQHYRLPNEDEWERAAGLHSSQSGIDLTLHDQNLGNFHPVAKRDPFEFTSPAGSFRANRFGFHDLAGNVWEYLNDDVGEDMRLIRGGSWLNQSKQYTTVQARGFCRPDLRSALYGFRIVLDTGRQDLARR